jgi:hypothetical protein
MTATDRGWKRGWKSSGSIKAILCRVCLLERPSAPKGRVHRLRWSFAPSPAADPRGVRGSSSRAIQGIARAARRHRSRRGVRRVAGLAARSSGLYQLEAVGASGSRAQPAASAPEGARGYQESPRPGRRFLAAGRAVPPRCRSAALHHEAHSSREERLPERSFQPPLPPGELFGRLRSEPFHSAMRNSRRSRSLHFSDRSGFGDLFAVESG